MNRYQDREAIERCMAAMVELDRPRLEAQERYMREARASQDVAASLRAQMAGGRHDQ